MKRLICALALLLALCLPCAALADAVHYDDYYEHDTPDTAGWIHFNGDSYIRTRPDPDAPIMDVGRDGSDCEYMNQTQYDYRGVAWYCVYWYGDLGWVSSKYTVLMWPDFL